jgi:hypothetical protein
VSRPGTTAVALAATVLAGCGADRISPPDPSRPFSTGGTQAREFPEVGVTFTGPADWQFEPGRPPLVASASSGSATVAIWRYPRTEPLPRSAGALDDAGRSLQEAAKQRDPSFSKQIARRVKVDGARAVELVGTEKVNGRTRRVRSTHVYAKGAELVIDTYAAPRDFDVVDQSIFQPLIRSTKIDPPRP